MLRSVSKLLPALLALAAFVSPVRAAAQASPPAAAAAPAPAATALRGDVNGDGQVTALDALAVIAYVVGNPLPVDYQIFPNGDANGDGRITTADALVIMGFAMGRDVSRFPVGTAIQVEGRADAMLCVGNLRELTVTCRSQQPPSQLPAGAHGTQIYSGQNVYVRLTSSNVSYNPGTQDLTFNVRVTNLIPQPLGVDSLGNVSPEGVRVFIDARNPAVMEVKDSAGTQPYVHDSEPYYQYPGNVAYNDSTANQPWKLHIPNTFANFSFKAYIATEVPKPRGYVVVTPAVDTLAASDTVRLTGVVKNWAGVTLGAPVHWRTSDATVASVDSVTGTVTAHNDGTATITARAQPDTSASIVHPSGTATIVVATASADSTKITPAPATISAGDTSLLTVQVRTRTGVNYTHSAGTVTLSADSGTLVGTTTGSTVTATDNHDGTYTAKFTFAHVGVRTISGLLNGTAIRDTAHVTVTAATPASMLIRGASPQRGTVGLAAGSPPGVEVQDAHGNPVPGVSVKFKVTTGGGKLSDGGPAADSVTLTTGSNGRATVTSWTLGTVAGDSTNHVVASSTGLNSVTFSASTDPGPAVNMTKTRGDNTSGTAGAPVDTIPQVLVADQYSNPISNATVTFAVATGGGSVTGGVVATDATGHASPTGWTLGKTVGTNTLTASATGPASVTFTITGKPGVPDSISVTGGNLQVGSSGTPLPTPVSVRVKDHYGNAVAQGTTVNFSASTGGSVAASATTNLSGDASVTWTPGFSPPGPNQLTATAVGGSNPSTAATAYVTPHVHRDTIQAIGNVTLGIDAAQGSLNNDSTANGTTLKVTDTTGTVTTAAGGSITFTPTGSYTYHSAAGFTGVDSVGYHVDDTHASAQSKLVFQVGSKVTYVTGGNAAAGDGRDISPFNTLSAATAAAGSNGVILVNSGSATAGNAAVAAGQKVYGQGIAADTTVTLNNQTVTLLAHGTRPTVGGLTLSGGGNFIRGVRVVNASGGAVTGANVGALTLSQIALFATGGPAIDVANGTLTATLDSLQSTNSTSTGVALSAIAGTLAVNGGVASFITNPAGAAVSINGSNPTFTFPGTISKTNAAGTGINLTSMTGGSATFSGPSVVLSTGSGAGVNMTSSSATVSFADSLKVTTTTGNGINATGGGTLTVGSNVGTQHSSISSTGGIALNVSSTTIGSAGLNFRSISASGGSNGIVLSSTGTNAGLTVSGDGVANSSGGTITNTTGSDGAAAGNGVYLSNTRSVNLSWMSLSGHQNHAVYGNTVRDVNLNHVRITGTNGSSNSGTYQEGAVHVVNATGGITVKNSRLDGSAYTAYLVEQLTGAPAADSIVAAFDTISTGQGSTSDVRGSGLQTIVSSGSANVRYRNNSVTYWWANGIQVAVQTAAGASTALIQNNKVNQTSGALGAAGGIEVNGGSLAFNISGNSVTGTDGTAISVDKNQGNTFLNGTIDSNTIGTSGVTNSGSATGTGIFVQHAGPNATTVKISNNTIRQINGTQAIWALLGDDTGGGGSGTMNATITGNNIAEEGGAASARTGIVVQSGRVTGDTDVMCADVQSNSITNFNNRIRPNERFTTTMRVRGYTGANNDNTAMNNYLTSVNAGTVNVSSNNVSAGGPGFLNTSPAGSACAQPTL